MQKKITNSIFKKHLALGAAIVGCMTYGSMANAQCNSVTYGTTEAGVWSASSPANPPSGPYNGCPAGGSTVGATTTTNFYNHDHGFVSWYDGTDTWTWSRDLTGLDPSKTYEAYYDFTPQNTDHKRHLTIDYNLPGMGSGSYTTGIVNGIPNQIGGTYTITGKTNLHFTANLHCDAYQGCEPAQEARLVIIVREVITTPVPAPSTIGGRFGNALITNTCPSSTVDLSSALDGSCPSGFTTEWHTASPVSDANKVANPGAAGTGIYAAVCRKNSGDRCYTPISNLVYVATFPCGGGGFGGGGGGFNGNGARPAENAISVNSTIGKANGVMFIKGASELNLKYGTPVLAEGDASQIFINMDDAGNYNVVSQKPGIYKFNIPLLPPTKMEGEAPLVPLTVTVTSGVAEAVSANGEQAYIMPNPVSGNTFSFVFVNNKAENASLNIQLTDVNGRQVYTSVENLATGTNKIQIKTNGLAKGIYYLNYTNAALKISGKLKVAVN